LKRKTRFSIENKKDALQMKFTIFETSHQTKKMGCLKLAYRTNDRTLKVVYRKYAGSENSCTGAYRYGFNGKEKDDEINVNGGSYDFGARMYDTRLGRWLACDPLAAKYSDLSPYNFAANTPIQAFDPDGRLIIFINGMHTGESGINYWRNSHQFDLKVMEQLNDYTARYYDGALGGASNTYDAFKNNNVLKSNLNPLVRYNEGFAQGKRDAADIIAGLQRDESGKITETIKIVSHSMGSSYAKGLVAALNQYVDRNNYLAEQGKVEYVDPDGNEHKYKKIEGFSIELEVDFAPFQPNIQEAAKGVRTIQFSNQNDQVVNNHTLFDNGIAGSKEKQLKGVSNEDYHLDKSKGKGHSINDFSDKIKQIGKKQ
jgi:RHS repeat-associated protein